MALGLRQQQQPRRADAVRRNDHRARRLELHRAVGIVVACAGGAAVRPGGDLEHARAGAQLHAVGDRGRPVGDVGRAFGLLGAAEPVGAAVVARGPAAVGLRVDVGIRRPPMPAEPVEAARDALAVGPERQRRHRPRRARRIGRIAGDAGASHPGIVQIVVRLEVGIGDRPVVGHAVEAPDPEVGRVKARRMCGPMDGAAADRVEHQRRDRRTRCRSPDSPRAGRGHSGL